MRFRVQRRLGRQWGTVTGAFVRTAHPGLRRLHFRGRIGGRRLAVGRYRLVAYARDLRGARSVTRRAAFRIRR